jgi:ABC-type spermidine/putrescine transport system permease subunit II
MARRLLWACCALTLAFLTAPVLIVVPMSLSTSAFLQFPPPGFSFHWYHVFFADPRWREAIVLSAKIAVGATLLAVTIGTASAYALVRGRIRSRGIVQGVLTLPMVVPSIVFAVGAYIVAVRIGAIGSLWLLICAHALLGIPYVLLNISASLQTLDYRLELVAQTLGASRLTAVRLVTLPLIAPAVIASALIMVILSLDETVVSLFLTKDTAPTLPVKVYNAIRYQLDPVVPVAATVVLGGTVALAAAFLGARWLALRYRRIASESAASLVPQEAAA